MDHDRQDFDIVCVAVRGIERHGMIKHVHIESDVLRLDFRASAEQADNVVSRLRALVPDVVATIDDEVTDDLPLLPCARLWE